MSVLCLKDVSFSYDNKKVLDSLSYEFEQGRMYAVVGQSGAGKTTLLSLLSGLARPQSGEIFYEDRSIREINRYTYRSQYVGVIFQSFNLLSTLTAVENVVLSMNIAGVKLRDKKARAYELLESMGLDRDEADRRVLKLSGGQQQRVAIARALSYDPNVILADEPTGNLDRETEEEIMAIFRRLAEEGKCIIIVTHSSSVANCCDAVYELKRQKKKR